MIGYRRLGWIAAALFAVGAAGGPARAQGPAGTPESEWEKGQLGLGLVLGEPSGISLKYHLSPDRTLAVEGRFVVGVIQRGVGGHAGVVWSPITLGHGCVTAERFALPLYLGVGGRMLNHQRTSTSTRDRHLGIDAVVGIALDFYTLPVELFAEAGGVADWVDAEGDHGGFPHFGLFAGLGLRYYP